VEFDSSAVGQGLIGYQWQFNGKNLQGETNSNLILTNVQFSEAGTYAVVAANALGNVRSVDATLTVGRVAAWGSNDSGQTSVPPGLTNVLAIAAGGADSLVLKADGTVVAWGANDFGQTDVPSGLTNVVAIAAGGANSLALKADGTVVAWGENDAGDTDVPPDLTNVVAISAGSDSHSLALKADGTVVAWGNNSNGQTDSPRFLSNVVAIACGDVLNLALKSDGTVVAWGDNINGVPPVPAAATNVVAISARFGILALRGDGTVVAWRRAPELPAGLDHVAVMTGGSGQTLFLRTDGTVMASGDTNIPSGLANVVAVAGGDGQGLGTGSGCSLALVGESPPLLHTALVTPQLDDNGLAISIPTQSGRVYALEYVTSLAQQNWTALPLVAGTGKTVTLHDHNAISTSQQRFYAFADGDGERTSNLLSVRNNRPAWFTKTHLGIESRGISLSHLLTP
jgi:hypothetical protein